MLQTSATLQPVHAAATTVLVRDAAAGPEVLLLRRSRALRHMGGMWVFPGGRIDDSDGLASGDPDAAALNAAIRETREETGLVLSAEQLVPFSHWTTPEGAKRRYATWFFLGVVEGDSTVRVDGGEIAEHRWVRPRQALAEQRDSSNPFALMPPTYVSLVDIEDHCRCADARHAAAVRKAPCYRPRMVLVEDGVCFLYGGDAGYAENDLDAPGARHRAYMVGGQIDYIRRA